MDNIATTGADTLAECSTVTRALLLLMKFLLSAHVFGLQGKKIFIRGLEL
jgi:hypothetical protein